MIIETRISGGVDLMNNPIIHSTDIDKNTGQRYVDAQEYGRDLRVKKLMGKHLNELDLDRTSLSEYLESRMWSATARADLFGAIFEEARIPFTAIRFFYHKYGKSSS